MGFMLVDPMDKPCYPHIYIYICKEVGLVDMLSLYMFKLFKV